MKSKHGTKRKANSFSKARLLREWGNWSDREIVMARLARQIGRGHDTIYHGTRKPIEVLRSGKLRPSNDGAVYFTRSPEEAARCAYLLGGKVENWSPALLVFNRSSLSQTYRITPSRYTEDWLDEREEHVWDRTVSFRRHLLGVVREADVAKILGSRKIRFDDEFAALSKTELAAYQEDRFREGRAKVRELIIREREQSSKQNARSGATACAKAAGGQSRDKASAAGGLEDIHRILRPRRKAKCLMRNKVKR